jgi:tRNA threonylcarbamoyladenosine biosynthesis protein TsaB
MNILAFDTSYNACSVAVGVGMGSRQQRVVDRFEAMAKGQAERLLPMVADTLAAAGLALSSIDRLAVTLGPGTFTGTRITIAAARALALATRCPLVGLSSLEVIAHDPDIVVAGSGCDLMVAMDASRGETYAQLFDAPSRLPRTEPMRLSIGDAARLGGVSPVLVCGSAAAGVASGARALGRSAACAFEALLPRMRNVLDRALDMEPLSSPPRPLYLRPPDAKPQDGAHLPRVP